MKSFEAGRSVCKGAVGEIGMKSPATEVYVNVTGTASTVGHAEAEEEEGEEELDAEDKADRMVA